MHKATALLIIVALVVGSATGMLVLSIHRHRHATIPLYSNYFDACASLFAGALVALILLLCSEP